MSDGFDYADDLFGEDTEPVSVAILGSTGSIGTQALEVVRAHPGRFRVTALTANADAETLLAQAREFDVHLLGLTAGGMEAPAGTTVVDGELASAEVAEAATASVVLNAVVGAAGPTSGLRHRRRCRRPPQPRSSPARPPGRRGG